MLSDAQLDEFGRSGILRVENSPDGDFGETGAVYLVDQWLLHGLAPNTKTTIRSMFTHSMLRHGQRFYEPASTR